MKADGFSLDDKRSPVKENDIPDIIERFKNLDKEQERTQKDQSFFIDKQTIVDNDYNLSISTYKETEREIVEYQKPSEILQDIDRLTDEFITLKDELKKLLEN